MEQENNTNPVEKSEAMNADLSKGCEMTNDSKGKRCPLKPSTIINVFFLFAIAGIYFLYFFGNAKAPKTSDSLPGNLKIAYFNTDSVFQNYLMVNELRDGLKAEKEKLEGVFNTKQSAFEQKVKNYQTNLQNNSINAIQAQNAEKQLMKEREEIMQINEQYTQQLATKEMEINKTITDAIINFSQKFNKTFGADYILGYTKGGPIIVVNEKMDVTKEIIEGLNKEYNETKSQK